MTIYGTYFSTPVRWTLRVLSWLAFCVSGYLAWHAANQTSVAGCGVGSQMGCDVVLSSAWSRWLGIPVSIAGLGCYATLATLSVFLDWPLARAGRWITTIFTMLGIAAAVASLWFIGVQIAAIGRFCPYCLVTDACGIAIGALAIWSMLHWQPMYGGIGNVSPSAPGLMALRSALPQVTRTPAALVPRSPITRTTSTPSRMFAVSGAVALVIVLIGGQLLFPGKTYELRQVALKDSIEMDAAENKAATENPASSTAQERTAMRLPADSDSEDNASSTNDASQKMAVAGEASGNSNLTGESSTNSPPAPLQSDAPRHRLVKFFDGKLTLDTYKHPIIGSPEAPHVVIEMVSYDCTHCRKMHRVMQDALKRYGDQVAILIMVIPLERSCNRLVVDSAASHPGACSTARMALGVAALKPAAFPKFHDWLMADKDKPPAAERVVSRAYEVVDGERLREMSRSDKLTKQIEGYVNLYSSLQTQSKNPQFGLPVQVLGNATMNGESKAEDVYKAWEEHLGVTPK